MEEKMMILKMLQDGRITPEEAYKLLEALDKGGSKVNDIKEEFSSKINEMKIDEKLNKFGEKAAKIAETLGEKAGKFAEQLGERFDTERTNSGTEKFSEEFTKRIESLGHDIAESAGKFADIFSNQFVNLFDKGYEKYTGSYEYPTEESASIQFRANNFSVRVAPSGNKNISIYVSVNSNIPQFNLEEHFKAVIDNNSYNFNCELPGKAWGKIEMQVPENLEILKLYTDNGKCEISGIQQKALSCSTNNGKVYISKCAGDEIEILTDNGRVLLEESSARAANIRTSNAKVEITDCTLDNIDAKTTNGAIEVVKLNKNKDLESSYILSTTNGKIYVELGKSSDCECMVEATTTMGSIDVTLPKLLYTLDKKNIGMHSNAVVKSDNYDISSDRIYIKADTSNASINIENNGTPAK